MSQSLSGKVDVSLIEDVRNHMFGSRRGGNDLYSTNIFRARDMGMPGYNDFRADLGLPRLSSWSDVTSDVRVQHYLNDLYNSTERQANFPPDTTAIDHCDPYVCGLAEVPTGSSILGDTFSVVLEKQFEMMRNGDRLWYENEDYFTPEEIQYVYGRKLKDLIVQHFSVDALDLPDSPFYVDARQLDRVGGDGGFFWPDPEGRIAALGRVHPPRCVIFRLRHRGWLSEMSHPRTASLGRTVRTVRTAFVT